MQEYQDDSPMESESFRTFVRSEIAERGEVAVDLVDLRESRRNAEVQIEL